MNKIFKGTLLVSIFVSYSSNLIALQLHNERFSLQIKNNTDKNLNVLALKEGQQAIFLEDAKLEWERVGSIPAHKNILIPDVRLIVRDLGADHNQFEIVDPLTNQKEYVIKIIRNKYLARGNRWAIAKYQPSKNGEGAEDPEFFEGASVAYDISHGPATVLVSSTIGKTKPQTSIDIAVLQGAAPAHKK